MGRPCSVSDQEIILLIQKYIEFFKDNNFPVRSAQVWENMSKELQGRWKPHSVYTHVRENKKKNLETARQNLGINIPYEKPMTDIVDETFDQESELAESDDSVSENDENEDPGSNFESFGLILSPSEWDAIKPDQDSQHQQRLKPRVWSNVISRAFWNMYKLPCAFLGKWSYVRSSCNNRIDSDTDESSSSFYLKFKGSCKSKKCANIIIGIADKKPIDGKLMLDIKTRDTRNSYHEDVKRPLNGPERKTIGRELKRKIPVGYRQKLLADNMGFGENEPPWVQKSHVYRQAKMEVTQKDLGIVSSVKTDTITDIRNFLSNPRYGSVIRELGAKHFYVFYCSKEQIFVQKEYCRVKKPSARVCLDATGSVVKKFEIYPGRKTGHIFLYTVTINFEGRTLPVCQMLSEKHSAFFISCWLKDWIQGCSATIPDEAVADLGRALLLAMCDAFNRMTLKEYIDVLFTWATRDNHEPPRPFNTYIRADVAHLMAAVSRWKCIKSTRHSVVKGFYLRSVALMIDAQSVQEFERLFRLTCLVALHEDESKRIVLSGADISILEARQRLEYDMAERREMIGNLETSKENINFEEEVQRTLDDADEKCEQNFTVTHRWIKSLISRSTPDDEQTPTCKAVNGFYFPDFIPQLERMAKDFPIWSAACLPDTRGHATTADQEKYFSEMKRKIFEGIPLPCSAHRFLKEHIDDLQCGANEIATKLKHYNHKHREPLPYPSTEEVGSRPALEKFANSPPQMIKRSAANVKETTLASNSFHQKSTKIFQKLSSPVCPSDIEFQNDIQSSTPNEKTAVENTVNFDFDSVNLLYNKAGTVNDSDLKCDEAWMGLINDDTFMNIDIDFDEGNCLNDQNNNLIVSEQQYQNTSLLDHSYCKLTSNENLPEINGNSQQQINDENLTLHEAEKHSTIERNETTVHGNDQPNPDTKKRQGVSDKKKPVKVGHYFESYRQVRFVNEKLQIGGKKGCLLTNGSKSGIVKMGDIVVDLQETCGFDAIINLLQFGAINNRDYHDFVKSSNNRALQFLCRFIELGPTAEILKKRIILLNEYYPLLENPNAPSIKVYKLNANDSITTIWKHLFCSEPAEPTASKSGVCSNPVCIQTLPTDIAYFEVNNKIIHSKGIRGLQEAVIFHKTLWNVKCRQKGCPGSVIETIRPNTQILIDLDCRTHKNPGRMLECKLDDIPVSLNFTKEYRLIGVIEYTPQHFKSYNRNSSGCWMKLDDLEKDIIRCFGTTKITPVGAIYTAAF